MKKLTSHIFTLFCRIYLYTPEDVGKIIKYMCDRLA